MSSTTDILIKNLAETIVENQNKKPSAYDTRAEVRRVEGDIAWVHIPGGVDETPVQLTTNAKKGDIVQVRVSGGSAWLYGNATSPPTDDTKAVAAEKKALVADEHATDAVSSAMLAQEFAETARESAESAIEDADRAWRKANSAEGAAAIAEGKADEAAGAALRAEGSATEAKTAAQNASEYASRALGNLSTVQSVAETLAWITQHGTMTLTSDVALDPTHVYFVADADGDYTVGGVTYAIVTEPDVADISTYYELTIDESLNNYVGTHLALTSEGLWLLPASSGTSKVLIATGGGTTYTTAGTYLLDSSGGTAASFRANGATIGENASGKSRVEIGTDGMKIVQNVNGSDTILANIGYGVTQLYVSNSVNPFYSFGNRKTSSTPYNSTATYRIGDLCLHEGYVRVCTTEISRPEAWNSNHWSLAIGSYSNVEGNELIASGECSHAEGRYTRALGEYAHAEGYNTRADVIASHAEGFACGADGEYGAHAEGYNSHANGDHSHAQNLNNYAWGTAQTVLGSYATEDYDTPATTTHPSGDTAYRKYAVVIGNGAADDARSNALTVAWNGNTVIAGTLTQGSDRRLKNHISYLDEDAIEFVRQLKPAHYIKDGADHVGFYAQDVESVDAWNCMIGEMNGYKTLGYTELIAPLVAYCQHLEKRIEELEDKK